MWGLLIAIISGALMSIQGVFNTGVTKQTSNWLTTAWVAFSGFVLAFILWFIFEREQAGIMSLFKVDNKYMLIGGVIGTFITWTVIKSMSELGPAKAVLLIVIAQLLIAYLIELFGIFEVEKVPFQWSKLIGIVIAIVGFIIFKWEKQ
ncbi:MAG: DMT family transporter [Clostridium sp.]|nr:DMT family transporter [Clostridium sp.]MCM1172858.1 DMT family transporter [Clostridium sp.]MCM1209611.1 DMT family transporter [Ruminococcus sp.]MCM1287643.1 DMT family transporter [Clostridium sp.]